MKQIKQIRKSESLELADSKLSDFSTPLIVGFDGKRAVGNFTGLGNYSRFIIQILTIYFPENDYLVYSAEKSKVNSLLNSVKPESIRMRNPKSGSLRSWWRSIGISKDLQKDDIQVYHGLSNELPFGLRNGHIKSVVTVHDLIFLRFPEYYPLVDRLVYKIKFKYACKNADKIIAISQQTKRDIIHFFNIPENRIEVIYQNCNKIFREEVSETAKTQMALKYALPDRYILNVGTIESRKNLLLITRALIYLNPEIHLVVIGKETGYAQKVKDFIRDNGLIERVHFLKNVPHEDLPVIYRQAQVFVFPSRFEGFGIPILEAMHSGVPVIAASGSCLEEAGGPESLYVKPDDHKAMAEAINLVLTDPEQKRNMVEVGKEYVKQFSDEIIATQIMDLYKSINHA